LESLISMNKSNKLSVIVAIPAFNEEANIVKLIKSIRMQDRKYYDLSEFWIYSDGSTDNTVSLVRKHFKDVKVFDFKKNMGKNKRVNQILRSFKGDVLIQVDADIKIIHKNVIDNLVKPFYENRNPGIVCAYHLASFPNSFVEKVAYFGFSVWNRSRNSLGEKGIRYFCEGGLRAFSKDFTKIFRLPEGKAAGEDSYSFYFAATKGFNVEISKNSKVYIDLAGNFRDYVRQMKRFLIHHGMMLEYFDARVIRKYEILSFYPKFTALVVELIKTPLIGIFYLLLQAFVKVQMPFYKPNISWVPVKRK